MWQYDEPVLEEWETEMPSKIEWTDETWNPVTGCTKVSVGCKNCYAERMAKRLAGRFGYPADKPFAVTLHWDRLEEPLRWRKPRRVFVCSMGDLFHEDVPDEFIGEVFGVVHAASPHIFQVLTKRPERMRDFILRYSAPGGPLPSHRGNLWLGVSVEDQATADERIPLLLKTPAAVRFVSYEPALAGVDFSRWLDPLGQDSCINCGADERHYLSAEEQARIRWTDSGDALCGECGHDCCATGHDPALDWCIAGGESGPGARPVHPDWLRSVRDQCAAAAVPFFFKGWGAWVPNSYQDWREDQRVYLGGDVSMWRHGYLAKKWCPPEHRGARRAHPRRVPGATG